MAMAIKVASNGNVEYMTIEGHGPPANRKTESRRPEAETETGLKPKPKSKFEVRSLKLPKHNAATQFSIAIANLSKSPVCKIKSEPHAEEPRLFPSLGFPFLVSPPALFLAPSSVFCASAVCLAASITRILFFRC